MPKIYLYLASVVCTLYFGFLLGCTPENTTQNEANKVSSTGGASGRSSTDVPKKEVSVSKKMYKMAAPSSISINVSSSLRAMIEKMKSLGITKKNAKQLEASSLSTPFVKVNDEGNIQTYVHVNTFGADEKAFLEAQNVVIEITNEELKIFQAWIPFDKIDAVAKLPFVKQITLPRYGTPWN